MVGKNARVDLVEQRKPAITHVDKIPSETAAKELRPIVLEPGQQCVGIVGMGTQDLDLSRADVVVQRLESARDEAVEAAVVADVEFARRVQSQGVLIGVAPHTAGQKIPARA